MKPKVFKKGDWVITPYNKYPYQLKRNGVFGVFVSMFLGMHFFEVSESDAIMMKNTRVYAIKDLRSGIIQHECWYDASTVRFATKKDMKLTVDLAKKDVKNAITRFKRHKKEMENL